MTAPPIARPALLVCGSHNAWQKRLHDCAAANLPVGLLDATPIDLQQLEDASSATTKQLRREGVLVLSTGQIDVPHQQRIAVLKGLAAMTEAIVRQELPATLLVEGGATAAAVAAELGWLRFAVHALDASGVGVLTPISDRFAPTVLIKPGSYPWPTTVWQAFYRCRSAHQPEA